MGLDEVEATLSVGAGVTTVACDECGGVVEVENDHDPFLVQAAAVWQRTDVEVDFIAAVQTRARTIVIVAGGQLAIAGSLGGSKECLFWNPARSTEACEPLAASASRGADVHEVRLFP